MKWRLLAGLCTHTFLPTLLDNHQPGSRTRQDNYLASPPRQLVRARCKESRGRSEASGESASGGRLSETTGMDL